MITKSSEREKLTRRLGAALQNLIQSVEAAKESAAREQKLHPTDFACIGLLHRATTALSPKQIIETMNLRSSSGTALLDRLEANGYITRVPNPDDRRSILVRLNEDQASEPLKRYAEIEHRFRAATDNLSDADLELISGYLVKVTDLTKP